MRVFRIITALVASGAIFYIAAAADASIRNEVIKTKAIRVFYKSPSSAYTFAHRACQKHWQKEIANIVSERPSLSVEIITVNINSKSLSALCVSRKFINDDVTRLAKR